ncbi:MAG: oxidoreductase [Bacteroidetes bacterium]|nr:oxidoreductase [Bacteroidota bacterium]
MAHHYHDTEIIEIVEETPTTKRFYFKVPHLEDFFFKPGQFVLLDLPIISKVSHRSYSIASAPGGDNVFELLIVLNPTGLGTPHMWDHYKVGVKVPYAGPLGKFVLHPEIEDDLCLICTGTGIAPFRSMIQHIMTKGIPHKNIYLIFGSRYQADILYKTEMAEYEAKYPEFKFIPVLSRETPETWNGKLGYVHQVYEEIFADKRPAHFYICGWKAMVKEARDRLTAMGYTRDRIKFELYD